MTIINIPYLQFNSTTGELILSPNFNPIINVGFDYQYFRVSSIAYPLKYNGVFIAENTTYECNSGGKIYFEIPKFNGLFRIANFTPIGSWTYSANVVYLQVALFSEGEIPPTFQPSQVLTVNISTGGGLGWIAVGFFENLQKFNLMSRLLNGVLYNNSGNIGKMNWIYNDLTNNFGQAGDIYVNFDQIAGVAPFQEISFCMSEDKSQNYFRDNLTLDPNLIQTNVKLPFKSLSYTVVSCAIGSAYIEIWI